MKEYERTFQQWKELAARYFEAEQPMRKRKHWRVFWLLQPHRAKSSTNFVPSWDMSLPDEPYTASSGHAAYGCGTMRQQRQLQPFW